MVPEEQKDTKELYVIAIIFFIFGGVGGVGLGCCSIFVVIFDDLRTKCDMV